MHETVDPVSLAQAAQLLARRTAASAEIVMEAGLTTAQFRTIQLEVEKFGERKREEEGGRRAASMLNV